jgi:phosphopantothenoylcysteine decarboxylase
MLIWQVDSHLLTTLTHLFLCRTTILLQCFVSTKDAEEEWNDWNTLGDPVLHIDLRDWADAFVIAPLSAHTLAKIAQGLCDDTLSCVARAWDFGHGARPGKPMLLAPAMNTAMWQHPLTEQQLTTIQGFWNCHRKDNAIIQRGADELDTIISSSGVKIVSPQVKTLACGEVGNGALAPVEDILRAIEEVVTLSSSSS